MGQGGDAFDTWIALEDSDGFLGGGDDSERLRGCGDRHGLGLGLRFDGDLERDAMEGWVKSWVGNRGLNLGEESVGRVGWEYHRVGCHGCQCCLHCLFGLGMKMIMWEWICGGQGVKSKRAACWSPCVLVFLPHSGLSPQGLSASGVNGVK